ncbi:hypothetical protein AUJ68_04275 [Candidatus Woesearchaeota archaeon CG1_02_57_44]|nr:MAG: hypothetical protein AUJ68_04275 [Candidatus Woesearchaeota archaeon CG1_02_57_44]PIN69009.1 MAG: hypothetical protein COV94_03470 [Candidatus Woesearchaeota archaeon CG11_big_fil_rev_8_21_14_0_20_57_5]
MTLAELLDKLPVDKIKADTAIASGLQRLGNSYAHEGTNYSIDGKVANDVLAAAILPTFIGQELEAAYSAINADPSGLTSREGGVAYLQGVLEAGKDPYLGAIAGLDGDHFYQALGMLLASVDRSGRLHDTLLAVREGRGTKAMAEELKGGIQQAHLVALQQIVTDELIEPHLHSERILDVAAASAALQNQLSGGTVLQSPYDLVRNPGSAVAQAGARVGDAYRAAPYSAR